MIGRNPCLFAVTIGLEEVEIFVAVVPVQAELLDFAHPTGEVLVLLSG